MGVPPTSADIVQRFGLHSSTFVTATHALREALKIFSLSEAGALEVKRQQWAFHLARVYGSADVSNDEMFVRHTYLCQFAKLLAYTVRFGVGEATQRIEDIIDGSAFEILGVSNIGEQDFFAWVLAPEIRSQTLDVFKHIAASLTVYNLQNIDEDLLKQLYQNLVEPETRHESGEFYTPDWLAELTLREIGYNPGQSLLDPACGSGTFLFTAIRLLVEQGMTGQNLVDFALENIMGIDVHPLAVTIARINYMLAILPHMQHGRHCRQERVIPVKMASVLHMPNISNCIEIGISQNSNHPIISCYRKFDVVVGNPPWISYRYLQDQTYQAEIKKLIFHYKLHNIGDSKLNTHMELATLFFEHCSQAYLKSEEGTIAFVMPRSVITGAKQHSAFQQHGFSRVLDLKDVAPLFNVETCVMIREHNQVYTRSIPTTYFVGILPAHECTWEEASLMLTQTETVTNFVNQEAIASLYYFPRFKQGATLVPRNLAFVTSAQPDLVPGKLATMTSIMRTDPDANDEAKIPWKDLKHEGYIDDVFLYATLLSKQLVPFGIGKLHLVALPVRVAKPQHMTIHLNKEQEKYFMPMSLIEMHANLDLACSADDWFEPVEQLWQTYRKSTSMSLWERFNYQQGIVGQSAAAGYLVLYGATGSNLSACVLDTDNLPVINGAQPGAFVADHKVYWYRAMTKNEAHFLAALLNAPCVDGAIKEYQTRGILGPRDIHRRPFEVCAIPQFKQDNPYHLQLALLSQAAHNVVATLDFANSKVVAARKQARQAIVDYITQIDTIAQRLLGLSPVADVLQKSSDDEGQIG